MDNLVNSQTSASPSVHRRTESLPLPPDDALRHFCLTHNLSLEVLLAAAASPLLDCYSSGQYALSYLGNVASAGHPATLVSRVALTPGLLADSGPAPSTIQEWLQNIHLEITSGGHRPAFENNPDAGSPQQPNQLNGVHLIVAATSSVDLALQFAHKLDHALVLSLNAAEPLAFSLALSYSAGRLTPEFARILLESIMHVLAQLPCRFAEPVSSLTLVPPSVFSRYLDSGQLSSVQPTPEFVHQLIHQQARQSPHAVAAVFRDRQITYAELVAGAGQLAARLQALGSRPGVLVAIHLGRSIHLLTSILAVLQTGAAFLPLDASLPAGRIAAVLEDSQSPIVITVEALAGRFEETPVQLVLLDRPSPTQPSTGATPVAISPADLAYVIYTSGSTGMPKGVMIEHRNLSAFLSAFDQVGDPASGTMLAIASASFDVSIIELLWTLSRGMRIILHEGDEGAPAFSGPASVAAQILEYGVTHLLATPTCMRILADDKLGCEALRRLRFCLIGGESFPPSLAHLLLNNRMSGRIVNGYGPTETTVCATWHTVDTLADPVPIGKPLANTIVYVVDRFQRLLPPLAPGELLLGGPSVGRGYVRRPELTADRFIPNPFTTAASHPRLYRTGDRVRLNLSGQLEFLERLDSQVKISGFRIELGEIESAIQQHPAVQHAAAVVGSKINGQKILAAYYTCRASQNLPQEELRHELSRTLPHYMVPPVLRQLPELPLSSSGKIDRPLLAKLSTNTVSITSLAPERSSPDADPELARLEAQLCSWCCELLHLAAVEPTDDYFEIGGESLSAAQLIRRIAAKYDVDVRLSTLVKARTLRALALHLLSASASAPVWSPVVPLRTAGSRPPLFLIAGLGGNVLNFDFVSRLFKDRPVYGVETHGLNADGAVLMSVEAMATTYLNEIRKIMPAGPYHFAGYSFGGVLAFEMAHQLLAQGERVGLLAMLDTSEWGYSRRVLRQLSLFRRLDFMYGHTIRQIVCGPHRLKTLTGRLRATFENRRLIQAQNSGHGLSPAVARVEQRNYHALSRYLPTHYDGAIHLFRTTEESPLRGADRTLGWSPLCSSLTVEETPGEHETMTTQAFAAPLASRLENALLLAEHRDRIQQSAARARSERAA